MNIPLQIEYEFYYHLARKLIEELGQENLSDVERDYFNFWHRQKAKFRSNGDKTLDGFYFCIALILRDRDLIQKMSQGRNLQSYWKSKSPKNTIPEDYCPTVNYILSDMIDLGMSPQIHDLQRPRDQKEINLSQNLNQQFKFLLKMTFDLLKIRKNSRHRLRVSQWVKNLLVLPENADVEVKIRRNETVIFLNYILQEGKCDDLPKEWNFMWDLPRIDIGRRERITTFMDDLRVPEHGVFVFLSFNNFGTP